MRAECQFAKAGQGLFYNGILVDDRGKQFSFVYDCGTLKMFGASKVLSASVQDYKGLIGSRLDLLFISHFHQDHISHIPELLSGISLGTVVIPHVDDDMRLLLAAQFDGIDSDGDRISFFRNPSRWLLDRGAEHVIVIYGSDDLGEMNSNDEPREPRLDFDPSFIKVEAYSSQRDSSENSEPYGEIFECEWCDLQAYHYAWEFKTFNPYPEKYDPEPMDGVKAILEENNNDFRKILRDKSLRRKLKNLYDKNFCGNINDTSLVVRSRPLTPARMSFYVDNNLSRNDFEQFDCNNEPCSNHCSERADTLLLGDVSLNNDLIHRLFKRYTSLQRCIPRVVLIPHHGARPTFPAFSLLNR